MRAQVLTAATLLQKLPTADATVDKARCTASRASTSVRLCILHGRLSLHITWSVTHAILCDPPGTVLLHVQGRVKAPKQAQLLYNALAALEGKVGVV